MDKKYLVSNVKDGILTTKIVRAEELSSDLIDKQK